MMNYRLIAIDLDGTLLNDEKQIPNNNVNILRNINNIGVEIVIATGRKYRSAKELIKALELNLVVMANNGNIARNTTNDKVLVTKYLNPADFYTLVKEGRKEGLHPIVHVDHYNEGYDIIIELDAEELKYSPYMSKNLDNYKSVDDFLNYKDAKVLAVCYVGNTEKLEKFQQIIRNECPNKYSSHIMSKLTIAGGLLEVMNPLGSKWLSLREYALEKGIRPEEIIAIGDDNNDIEMIKKAGLGIGMKNGSHGAKEAADIITDKSNNEGGVGEILKKVFKL